MNPDCFADEDYLCSYVSDRPAPPTTPLLSTVGTPPAVNLQSDSSSSFSPFDKPTSTPNKLSSEELPSSFKKSVQSSKQKLIVSPASVMPYPKGSPCKTVQSKRRRITTEILTSSPVLEKLKEKAYEKNKKKQNKLKKLADRNSKGKKKQSVEQVKLHHMPKKKLIFEESSESEDDILRGMRNNKSTSLTQRKSKFENLVSGAEEEKVPEWKPINICDRPTEIVSL